jgi:hypothetical protein
MNPEYDRQLEREIDRQLKGLPELQAPATLSRRVMATLQGRRVLPWYHQPWQYWPPPLRVAAFAFLSLIFGGVCVASWQLTKAAGVSLALQEVGGLFSGLTTLWNTLNVLLGAVVLVAKHLGTGFIVACAAIAGLGYALCLTLGTAWVRLASARR